VTYVPEGGDRPPLKMMRLGGQTGEPVPVQEVGRALARLWAGAVGPGESRIVRACQGNLIIWDVDSTNGSFEGTLEEMARIRPLRIILLEGAPGESPVLARISALCNVRGNRERVCCEKIALPLFPGAEDRTASAVRSLLRGDVPVLLWCPGEPPFGLAAFVDLCDDADSLLVDSAGFGDPHAGLGRLLHLQQTARGLHLLDWTWRRLGKWRRAVANGFDPPPVRTRIPALRKLTIELTATHGPGIPASVLLLVGWIAGTLRRSDLAPCLRAVTEEATLPERIRRLEFVFASGPPLEITLDPRPAFEENFPAELAELLGQRAGDRAYEESLGAAVRMKDAFGGEP